MQKTNNIVSVPNNLIAELQKKENRKRVRSFAFYCAIQHRFNGGCVVNYASKDKIEILKECTGYVRSSVFSHIKQLVEYGFARYQGKSKENLIMTSMKGIYQKVLELNSDYVKGLGKNYCQKFNQGNTRDILLKLYAIDIKLNKLKQKREESIKANKRTKSTSERYINSNNQKSKTKRSSSISFYDYMKYVCGENVSKENTAPTQTAICKTVTPSSVDNAPTTGTDNANDDLQRYKISRWGLSKRWGCAKSTAQNRIIKLKKLNYVTDIDNGLDFIIQNPTEDDFQNLRLSKRQFGYSPFKNIIIKKKVNTIIVNNDVMNVL